MKDRLAAADVPSGDGLFTVPVAAGQLTVAEKTLWAWIAARRIGVVRLGRSVRVPASEVQRIIREGTTPALRSA